MSTRGAMQRWFWLGTTAMRVVTMTAVHTDHNKWLRESPLLRKIVYGLQKADGLKQVYHMPQPVCSHGLPRCKELNNV